MKIVRTRCQRDSSVPVGSLCPGTVVRLKNCVSDIDRDPVMIIDMRSYKYQLEEMGCQAKVGVVNLESNKLSIIARTTRCYPYKDVEVHIP